MASAFGHTFAALAISQTGLVKATNWRLIIAGIVLSILPDADSIGFAFGIPYASFWGHRGFSHSIVFALLVAVLVQQLFFRFKVNFFGSIKIISFLFFSCVSHAVLDAMTTGGLGVAFFAPFDNTRYFFSFRPIKVSPINVKAFFDGKGIAVLKSEAIWIGIPCTAIILSSIFFRLIWRKF